MGSKKVGEAALETAYGEEGEIGWGGEVGQEIYVRLRGILAACDRSEDAQMGDTGGCQFRFGVAQDLENMAAVHSGDCGTRWRGTQ